MVVSPVVGFLVAYLLMTAICGPASVLETTAFVFHAPISTTHTITSAVMGVALCYWILHLFSAL